jgi:putative transposase
MAALRQSVRRSLGRQPEPSARSLESQSLKTATQGTAVGFDGHQKLTGRQRPSVVDPLGRLSAVVGTAASPEERLGRSALLTGYFAQGVKRRRKRWGEGGYRAEGLVTWGRDLQPTPKSALEVGEKAGPGFHVLPRRWVVERTVAWRLNYRRQSRDYEVLTANSEAMIQLSMIHLLLKRLA